MECSKILHGKRYCPSCKSRRDCKWRRHCHGWRFAWIHPGIQIISYIEDLETYLLKDIEVKVIDVDEANNRLVLSAREILQEKARKEREAKIAAVKVGSIVTGTVESLQNYGAFVDLGDGLSGLVHISQISLKRIKSPADVLNVGDEVTVKIIGIKDGKISLSMKALEEEKKEEEEIHVEIPKAEEIGTSLGDLFKGLKLD